MLSQTARPSSSRKSSLARRGSRALNRAVLETLESRTLLSAIQLDPAFGSGGFADVHFTAANVGTAISLSQPDGKIIVAGEASSDPNFSDAGDVALARLNPDGTLDNTFGTGGKVTLDFGLLDGARSMVPQPDGKILVGGIFNGIPNQSEGSSHFNGFVGVARLNSDGTLDPTFGNGGVATSTQIYDQNFFTIHILLQNDGKIVESGDVDNPDGSDLALTRFTSTGQVDTTFGTDGMSSVDFGAFDRTAALTADNSGRLLIVGGIVPANNLNERDIGVARFSADGTLDTTFGNGGMVVVRPGATDTEIGAATVAVDASGNILLGGQSINGNNRAFSLVRLTSQGALDASFGAGGRVSTDITTTGGWQKIYALVPQADGKILAAGDASSDLALARYNADGSLDVTFNYSGEFNPTYYGGAFSSSAFPVLGAVIQPDGKIVTVGAANKAGGTQLEVTRLILQPTSGPALATLDFSGGFANTGEITLNGPAAITASQLELSGSNASAWSTTAHDITHFTTSFSFKSVGPSSGSFAFVLQANSNTAIAGTTDHTVSLVFNPTSSSQFVPPGATGLFANEISANYAGLVGGSFSGMNFDNGDVYNVSLTYPFDSGGTQTILQTVTDVDTGATFSFHHEAIDIPELVGGGGAYVGFTGISGAYDILSWTYTSPSVASTPFAPSYLHYAPYTDPYRHDLTWTDNSTNEDGFIVERSVEGGPWSDLATLPANATSYSDSAISLLTKYGYAVRAVNGAGSSAESNAVFARPSGHRTAAPYAATATAVAPNEVDLTWQTDAGSGESCRVYRRTGGIGDYALLAQIPINEHLLSFADTQAPSGKLLEYHIVTSHWPSDYTHDAESDPVYVSATTPQTGVDHFGPTIALNGSARMVGSALQLTDNQPLAEAGSAVSTVRQAVEQFTTQFSFQFTNSDVGGLTFAMVGTPSYLGSPRGLGYGEGQNTGSIQLGVDFTIGDPLALGGGATGILFNTVPRPGDSVDVTSSGINFGSGRIFNVTLSMDGRIGVSGNALDETIVDAVSGATFRHTYWVQSMESVLDFVGLTAGKPASSQQSVNILSWSYSTNNQANPTTTFLAAPVAVPSTLSATATGTYGGTATLTATLQANGTAIPGALVSFTNASNVPIGVATTNANGIAILPNVSLAGINAGTYANAYHATFAGDAHNLPSSASASLLVAKADALINVSGVTGSYTATPHGATGTATGVGGVDLSAQLNLGASFTNAPGGTANWSFSGGTNYNDATGTVDISIAKASLTGIATTQDALNIAKQGAFTIDINSITGLQSGDTMVSVFSSAVFSLTIGANTYLFAPTVTVDAATQTIHVAYSLKAGTASADTLRTDLLALDAADGTVSTSAAKTPYSTLWITADSLNYTFTDDFLTRLFSSK